MSTGAALAISLAIVAIGGAGIYMASRAIKPPITAVVQAPSAATAGVQAIAMLASKGIDAYIAAKVNADK